MPATNSNGYNVDLTDGLWPPLVYAGDGANSVLNPQESLYSSLKWSDSDKVITIVLKPWKWSDGTPITSRDFTFTYNLLKANYNDWFDYVQGLFPVDVAKVRRRTPHRGHRPHPVVQPAVLHDNVLATIPLMPQHAWDKTSLTGKVGNYDQTRPGAKAVWNFLQKQGGDMATFATNPLWQVVDGPWKLSQFQSSGYYAGSRTRTTRAGQAGPEQSRSGRRSPTDTAEMDTLRSGTSTRRGETCR